MQMATVKGVKALVTEKLINLEQQAVNLLVDLMMATTGIPLQVRLMQFPIE
jgi:hypothetical protein